MNRSILIVICDFLLVSLLAFSTADIGKVADPNSPKITLQISSNSPSSMRSDLENAMGRALSEERKSQLQLQSELQKVRDAATRQEAVLSEKEKQVQNYQQALQNREQESARLQKEQADLQRQYAASQTNIQALNQKLQSASTENVISRESLAATQAQYKQRTEEAAALQKKIDELAKANQQATEERLKLSGQLQVAEAEKRSAAELAARMEQEVKVEREEKAKLAEGVKVLATKSTELAQEIRDNRPLAPNMIFDEFVSNRVDADFKGVKVSALGFDSSHHRDTHTILITDNTNIFALCHVQDTPLVLWTPGTDWEGLTGTLTRNSGAVPIHSLSFYLLDPRVVLMPVTPTEAKQLGGKIYHLSQDPFKFQDAVVVGTRDAYYGECKFELDLSTPQYVRMDHNSLKGLFGKFNPSRGDLVFSRTGDLLGIMANSGYCMLVQNLNTDMTIQFGPDVRDQHTGSTLSILASLVLQKPYKLQ